MELLYLGLGWLAYACLHSLLADLRIKDAVARRAPSFTPYYRLAYNAVATTLAIPLLLATVMLPGNPLWQWQGTWAWLANGLGLAALAGFLHSARYYDMDEFLGLTPWRGNHDAEGEHGQFRLSPYHRYVRHPWYTFGLLLIWTRDINAPALVSATAMTLYFIAGSRLEDRKLSRHFGAAYEEYRCKVPGLIPLPWKTLAQDQADHLVTMLRHCPPEPPSPRR